MRHCCIFGIFALALMAMTSCQKASNTETGWRNLLDKDLSQWRIYQSYIHEKGYNGGLPLDSLGNPKEPIGYDKNVGNVFRVEDINGELVLHITGEVYGSIFTRESFRNYRLRLKVKFGEKKFEPRLDKPMDSGIIYHSSGECGADYFKTWMRGDELQVQDLSDDTNEGFGNYWGDAGAKAVVHADSIKGTDYIEFNPDGPLYESGGCIMTKRAGSPHGKWTDIELICYEGKSLHIINGEAVLAIQSSYYMDNGHKVEMKEGKIQLQCEAAELYYKDMEIMPIDSIPEEYQALFDTKQ